MTARTVSARDLETMAHAAHERVELPGPEGGWATAVINGRFYRARVAPAASNGRCGDQYDRHPTKPHLSAVCTRPRGHDGEHSNVLHKPGQDPDRDQPQETP